MPRKKIDIKDKKLFLNFVYLSDEEYSSLCVLFGKDEANRWIEELNGALGQHGYKYESHYWTIRNWTRRAGKTTVTRIESNAILAKKAADRVIEALKDPANKTMPDFDAKTRTTVYAMLQRRRTTWPMLREMRHDGTYMEEIHAEIVKAFSSAD